MLNKKTSVIAAVACITTVGLALGVTPAKAFDPVAQKFSIVGSDTLEDVVGALVNGSDISGSGITVTTADSSTMGSFDATGTGTIITKQYGKRFQRPNGSGDGRTALAAQINGTAYTSSYSGRDTAWDGQTLQTTPAAIDIVRASSGGTVSGDSTDIMQRFSFGRDGIAMAYTSVSGANALNFPDSAGYISASALKAIYQCDQTTLDLYKIKRAWIPQAGSGTRNDFVSKAGLSDTQDILANLDAESNLAVNGSASGALGGGCIHVGQEHDASLLGKSTTGAYASAKVSDAVGENDIMPMSASRWIAMKNGASYDKSGAALLGGFVAATAPTTGTAPALRPTVAYYKDSTWGRDTYLFVDRRRVDNSGAKTINPAGTVALTASTTGTASSASKTLTVDSTVGLALYQVVSGTGIAADTTVTAISGNTVTLSANTTSAVSGTVTFANVSFATGSLTGVFANLGVTGTGIASGSTVKSALVADATKTISGTAVTFPAAQKVLLGINAGSQVGQFLTGTGIAAGTQVTAVSATSTVATNKTSGTQAAAATTITLDGVTGVAVGQQVQYLGIKANTYVTAINGNVVTISNPLVTSIATGKAITFADVTRNQNALSDTTTSIEVETAATAASSHITVGSAVTGTNVEDDVIVTAVSSTTITVNKGIMKSGKTSSSLANTLTFVKNEATLSQPLTADIAVGSTVTAANTLRVSKAITAGLTSASVVTTSNTFYNATLAKLFDYTYDGSLVWQGTTTATYANMTDSTVWPSSDIMALKLKFGFLPASTQPTNEYAH